MGVQDRDWYREAYANKERKYNGNFSLNKENEQSYYNAIWDEVNKKGYSGKVSNRRTYKPMRKRKSNSNTNNQNGSYVFLGKTLKVENRLNGYFVQCACGNCNCITEIRMQNRPKGTYNYVCPKCKSTNEFKAHCMSLIMWVLLLVLLAILYVKYFL